ncbi:MAG: DUF2511 domain-containing protein [Myxococcota bacterium]|nr:DUF2511 domain-containing protein [Myxococcota bacterium]
MSKDLRLAAPAGLLLAILAGLAGGCVDRGVVVTRDQFGDAWPLAVNSARVECGDGGAAVLRVGSKRFALNAAAESQGHPEPAEVLSEGADPSPLLRACAPQVAASS